LLLGGRSFFSLDIFIDSPVFDLFYDPNLRERGVTN